MNWTRYGPNALLFRFADSAGEEAFMTGCAIAADLERKPPPGMIEFVPAFTTMLVAFKSGEQAIAAAGELARRFDQCAGKTVPTLRVQEIPIVYDGPDLQRLADMHGLTAEQIADIHSATTYKVYMLGFSPGFPYLGDLDPRLHTPRLASPRTRVAAGSVAIGGSHTGIYSIDSPGGWNIIGHTTFRLFDPSETDEHMFSLRHGDRVRFVQQRAQ